MDYFVAILNIKTGKYELSWDENGPVAMDKEQALKSVSNNIVLGHAAMLLQRPILDVEVSIRPS